MMQIVLVGLGAGAAAALLLAAPFASGSVLAFLLLYFWPLPIMIAALGWTHWAGLLAAFTAAAALGALFGFLSFAGALIGMAMPAWWLGYLALLARPTVGSGVEWYPIGRIVLWAALLGAAIVATTVLLTAADQDTLRNALRKALDELTRTQLPSVAASVTVTEGELDLFVRLLPAFAASSFFLLNSFNLWLAGRIVLLSGRLRRPWPMMSDMSLPLTAPVLLAAAVAGTVAPYLTGAADLTGTLCASLAGPLLVAHVMVGFAVIHAVTIGAKARVLILAVVYVGFLVVAPRTILVWLGLGALGLAETLFGIRGRLAASRIPPRQRT